MKTLVACICFVVATWAAQTAPPAGDPAEKLSAMLGRWEIEGTAKGQSATQGETRTLRECRWAPQGHDYLICSLTVASSTKGDHRQLTIYSYNPKENNYLAVVIVDPGMQPTASSTLNIQGNTWTTVTESKVSTQVKSRSTTERLAPDRATVKIEASTDGGAHWMPIASATEKKVGD